MTNRLPSHGELVASVELLIAHITQFSNRLDRIESRVNDWVNLELAERMMITEQNINTMKTCINKHDTKIESTNIELDYAFDSIKYTNERMVENEKMIDRISDILTEHESKLRHAKQRSRDLAKKYAEIGILRRRISKVEEFNTEFAECFETPSQLRGIIAQTSDQAEDCDRTLTHMVRYGCGGGCVCASDAMALSRADEEEDGLEAWKNVEGYFANYEEKEKELEREPEREYEYVGVGVDLVGDVESAVKEEVVDEDDVNDEDDGVSDEDDDEFEKL
jgi:chromosome segregation ATPase